MTFTAASDDITYHGQAMFPNDKAPLSKDNFAYCQASGNLKFITYTFPQKKNYHHDYMVNAFSNLAVICNAQSSQTRTALLLCCMHLERL